MIKILASPRPHCSADLGNGPSDGTISVINKMLHRVGGSVGRNLRKTAC